MLITRSHWVHQRVLQLELIMGKEKLCTHVNLVVERHCGIRHYLCPHAFVGVMGRNLVMHVIDVQNGCHVHVRRGLCWCWLFSVKIAGKGEFYIKKFQACKSGENCVGVDNTLLYHQNTYDLLLCCTVI